MEKIFIIIIILSLFLTNCAAATFLAVAPAMTWVNNELEARQTSDSYIAQQDEDTNEQEESTIVNH